MYFPFEVTGHVIDSYDTKMSKVWNWQQKGVIFIVPMVTRTYCCQQSVSRGSYRPCHYKFINF